VQCVTKDTVFDISVRCYGTECKDFELYEDDGFTFDYKKGIYNKVLIKWNRDGKHEVIRKGSYKGIKYNICSWEAIK
jgi:alpha-D-xyloside xylohydrolase